MSKSTLASAKLYTRVALLRRKVLLNQFLRRLVAGVLAVISLAVAVGLSTYALHIAIREQFGSLGATLVVAGVYLVITLVLFIYAMRSPNTPELKTLEEMEGAALDVIKADADNIKVRFLDIERYFSAFGLNVVLTVSLLNALRKIFGSRKPPNPPADKSSTES